MERIFVHRKLQGCSTGHNMKVEGQMLAMRLTETRPHMELNDVERRVNISGNWKAGDLYRRKLWPMCILELTLWQKRMVWRCRDHVGEFMTRLFQQG